LAELSERAKKKLNNITLGAIGSYGTIIGQRSTQYDLKESEWWAREWAGHTIKAVRTSETAILASGLPTVDQFKKGRLPFWYIGSKGEDHYSGLMDNYIAEAKEWDVVKVDSDIIYPSWELKTDILDASGHFLRDAYSYKVYSHKGFQARSIVLLNQISKTSPLLKEIDLTDLGLNTIQLTLDLSRLESLGIVKRVGEGKDQKFVLLPIATEIYGKEVEKKLDDILANPFSRYVFSFIRKMPGISFSCLVNMIGIPLTEETQRLQLLEAMKQLRQNDIVIMIFDQEKDDLYLIPTWTSHLLIKAFSPTVLDSKLLTETIRICSNFWETVGNISNVDTQIDTLKAHIKWLLTKKEITFKEITELKEYAKLIYDLRLIGVIEPLNRESFKVVSKNVKVLEVLLEILSEAYSVDIETTKVSATGANQFLKEVNAALDLIIELLSEKLSLKDTERYQGL